MKRQRVSLACQKCRSLKAKCDGHKPSCGRCLGYGFICIWPSTEAKEEGIAIASPRGARRPRALSSSGPVGHAGAEELGRVVDLYEALVESVRPKLEGAERASVDMTIEHIRKQTPAVVRVQRARDIMSSPKHQSAKIPSYQGNASDIEFMNTVRGFMYEHESSEDQKDVTSQGYDQSDAAVLDSLLDGPLKFPPKRLASSYLEVYFSTIHIAYPFLHRPVIIHHFQNVLKDEKGDADERPWLGLLNALFAIGAYYMSFRRSAEDDNPSHSQYFEQSTFFSNQVSADCTLTTVWILLAQCFYLLATCHIDRCWNTLGLAVRVAQSIGLHVENSRVKNGEMLESTERELRRRTWYSLYVLDRLLSLQLGRPVAIHEKDFAVVLPSREEGLESMGLTHDSLPHRLEIDKLAVTQQNQGKDDDGLKDIESTVNDTDEDHDTGSASGANGAMHQTPSAVDYFLRVIQFSHILGRVIKELYRPTQLESSSAEMLMTISMLDILLSRWKADLPRHLRFDLGHAFEKSITLKRQRNMLAVKYHHIRALVHRPFLCLSHLRQHDPSVMELLQRARDDVERAERICVSEAQQTAHLLHNVDDERSLVHDFPWWQMIPCLICSSSILLVASAFWNDNGSEYDQTQNFQDDAETCLKVFEALSVNSKAAKKATDMLKGLSNLKRKAQAADVLDASVDVRVSTPWLLSPTPQMNSSSSGFPFGTDIVNDAWQWPSEISDTMEWSAQFLAPHNQPDMSAQVLDTYETDAA